MEILKERVKEAIDSINESRLKKKGSPLKRDEKYSFSDLAVKFFDGEDRKLSYLKFNQMLSQKRIEPSMIRKLCNELKVDANYLIKK